MAIIEFVKNVNRLWRKHDLFKRLFPTQAAVSDFDALAAAQPGLSWLLNFLLPPTYPKYAFGKRVWTGKVRK